MARLADQTRLRGFTAPVGMPPPSRPLAYAAAHRRRFVAELAEFVGFPSVSSIPQAETSVADCARWLAHHLRRLGIHEARVLPTSGHPMVLATWSGRPGAPTLLVYGHYDVQPAEPLEAWSTPPFRATIRAPYLIGRGASDDKGQVLAHLKAIESYLSTWGALPVNVIVLIEGEEEIGSPGLIAFLNQHGDVVASDVAVASDTAIDGPRRPAITISLRGALVLDVTVNGWPREVHSGVFGGVAPDAVAGLSEMLSSLRRADGGVAVRGFYTDVRRQDGGSVGRPEHASADGFTEGMDERHFTDLERRTVRPSLVVTGIAGGHTGAGLRAVVPSRATARLDVRLVPDQDPVQIEELIRAHLARVASPSLRCSVSRRLTAGPLWVDPAHPSVQVAASAYRRGFGVPPALVRSGATIPPLPTLQILGAPVVLMGFGLPDDRIHAADERFHLPTFAKAVDTSIWFLWQLGLDGDRRAHRSTR